MLVVVSHSSPQPAKMDNNAASESCPICDIPFSSMLEEERSEHVNACIESQTQTSTGSNSNGNGKADAAQAAKMDNNAASESCPICDIPFSSKLEEERTQHVNACMESQMQASTDSGNDAPALPPHYHASGSSSQPVYADPSSQATTIELFTTQRAMLAAAQGEKKISGGEETGKRKEDREWHSDCCTFFIADEQVGSLLKWFSRGDKSVKIEDHIARADAVMRRKWGPPESETHRMAMRYIVATRMIQYWEALALSSPGEFQKRVEKGYLNPIPVAWVYDRRLARLYPEGSYWETPAEKRLYFLLNNGVMPDGQRHSPIRPLNITRNRSAIIRRGNERNARQVRIDAQKLAAYQSRGDIFRSDKQTKSHDYSYQVPNTVTPARQQALHALADGILHGTDHLETWLLLDVSGSMTWNPHEGILGTIFSPPRLIATPLITKQAPTMSSASTISRPTSSSSSTSSTASCTT